jgi:hypothetical protein
MCCSIKTSISSWLTLVSRPNTPRKRKWSCSVVRLAIWDLRSCQGSSTLGHRLISGLLVCCCSVYWMGTSHSKDRQMPSSIVESKEVSTRWSETTFLMTVSLCWGQFWMSILTQEAPLKSFYRIIGSWPIRGKRDRTMKSYNNLRRECFINLLSRKNRQQFASLAIIHNRIRLTTVLSQTPVPIQRAIVWIGSWRRQRLPRVISLIWVRFSIWTMKLF